MASFDHALRFLMLAAAVTMILVALAWCGASARGSTARESAAREQWPFAWRETWQNPPRQHWEVWHLKKNWPSKRGCFSAGCY